MKKPDKCCYLGTYEHTIPTHVKGRRQDVDFCLADIIAALNAANITTVNSCCGHGKMPGTIILEDGRWLWIQWYPSEEDINSVMRLLNAADASGPSSE